MLFKKIILIITLLTSAHAMIATAQTWVVPDDQKAVCAPIKFTPEMQKQGEQVYMKICQSCHGLPGKDNWMKLTPPPGDLAKDKAQLQTDGELYYRITTGKAPMPEFRNILSDDDRWNVIAFIRTFNPKYAQPDPSAKGSFTGRTVALALQYSDPMKKVIATATEKLKDGKIVPAAGVEIILYVKRYFGNMQVGDMKTTNAKGEAAFEFPFDLPGNKDGYVDITVKVNDPKNLMKSTPASGSFAIGAPTDKPGLTETRAWWSTRDKTPIWLAITYTGSVLIIWGFIIYIIISILKIRKVAKA
ncbi:MAG: cytochrome c [Bacteroidota bacterium]